MDLPERIMMKHVSSHLLLTGLKATSKHASNLLDKLFDTPSCDRDPVILLVDELDLLWAHKQHVLYNLFK
ncbi:hypothetical protein ACROYT_G044760 [Oculina patagonica]